MRRGFRTSVLFKHATTKGKQRGYNKLFGIQEEEEGIKGQYSTTSCVKANSYDNRKGV